MSANRKPPTSGSGEPTVLELGDDRTPPVLVWAGSVEATFRPVPTEVLQFLLGTKIMGPDSVAAAIAELERRGVSPPPA